MSQHGTSNLNPKQLEKLAEKAKELGYDNLRFFVDDIDMLLRPAVLLKQKDMKYFELENLISLLTSKNISLGMAPRMLSMVSKYAERNEELEAENAELKQSNITMRSKYQTAEAQVKEYQKQLKELSVGVQADAKIREENIKLNEENKYLKITNESLTEELKKTKEKLDEKIEEANDLEVENSQLELKIKDLQRELKELELEYEELKRKGIGTDKTKRLIEDLIDEVDEAYSTVDDPFKKEFLAFMGVELSEIVEGRTITKQKILNQIAIHAHEIEKIFEPKIAALQQMPARSATPQPVSKEPREVVKKEVIPEPVKKTAPVAVEKEQPAEAPSKQKAEEETEDHYVKPSEFLKKKGIIVSSGKEPAKTEEAKEKGEEHAEKTPAKPATTVSRSKRKFKKKVEIDRTPSPELIQVFDVFIKYLEAITDNKSFNDLCDKIIEQLYEHIGSPGMTQVYKIKSGGVKRKQLLIDLIKQWKVRLPDL